MNAIRKTSKSGKATIEITFDDGTTAKVGGKRAARAAAVIVWRAGDFEKTEWSITVKPGWYVEGCRQTIASAECFANKMRKTPRWAGCPHDEVAILVVHNAETLATN